MIEASLQNKSILQWSKIEEWSDRTRHGYEAATHKAKALAMLEAKAKAEATASQKPWLVIRVTEAIIRAVTVHFAYHELLLYFGVFFDSQKVIHVIPT